MTSSQRTLLLRPICASDAPSIVSLLAEATGNFSQWTPRFWAWKHQASPPGVSLGVCAAVEPEGAIVCVLHAMRWTLAIPGGEEIAAARLSDGATRPEHRRAGIFSNVTDRLSDHCRDDGALFTFGTPNSRSQNMERKRGQAVAVAFPLHARPVMALSSLGSALSSIRSRRQTSSAPHPANIMEWETFRSGFGVQLPEVIAAHEATREHTGFRTPRTLAQLDWRYGSGSCLQYGVHAHQTDGVLAGFAVLRPVRGALGLNVLAVMDVFHRDPSTTNLRHLLRDVIRHAHCHYLLAHFAAGSREQRAMRSLGFFPLRGRDRLVTIRTLRGTSAELARTAAWDLTLGDLEVF